MTADDIVYAPRYANFHKGHCLVQLDRGVRDYLAAGARGSCLAFSLAKCATSWWPRELATEKR